MIPKLTHQDVQTWTDKNSFQRGEVYFQDEAIYDPRWSGATIKSKCSGNQAPFYCQEVTFSEKGIQSANCSCPIGTGGRCKHIIALLLTWLQKPESFQKVEELETVLEKRSKEELIALIRQFIHIHPDLEDLTNPSSLEKEAPLNLKMIRQQARRAMNQVRHNNWDGEWVDLRSVATDFQSFITLADNYLTQNNAAHAAPLYIIACEEILKDEDFINFDEEGELSSMVSECVEKLAHCLSILSDPKHRREILAQLFSIYQHDILDLGGIGFSDEIPKILIHQTSSEEKEEIARWIEEVMPKGESQEFGQRHLGKTLLELKKTHLNDEGYLALCRKTGQIHSLVDHLLKLNRVDEAVIEARTTNNYDLLRLAEIFIQYHYDSHAEELVNTRAKMDQDERLLNWLMDHAEKKKDYQTAFSFAEQIFWHHPSSRSFAELSRHGQKISTWDETRQSVLTKLEKQQEYILLSNIYLKEGKIEAALSSWRQAKSKLNVQSVPLQGELAQAAEQTLPHEAICLYWEIAESIISRKNRPAYVEAISYVKKMKPLYERLGEAAKWKSLISDLRAKYPSLRAFQDELNKAKL